VRGSKFGWRVLEPANEGWRALRLATDGDENGAWMRDIHSCKRWRPLMVWHYEAVRECGPERVGTD
jgi:hypothetical protein